MSLAARSHGRRVRSLLLTNPGNPTGVVLTEAELAAVVVWCVTNRIHLLADECVALRCAVEAARCNAS